jgi:hypothetical protein
MLKPDPRLRRDGTCSQCRGPRPAACGKDPFCSSVCCRAYFGLPSPNLPARRNAAPNRPDLTAKRVREATPEYLAKRRARNAGRRKPVAA